MIILSTTYGRSLKDRIVAGYFVVVYPIRGNEIYLFRPSKRKVPRSIYDGLQIGSFPIDDLDSSNVEDGLVRLAAQKGLAVKKITGEMVEGVRDVMYQFVSMDNSTSRDSG